MASPGIRVGVGLDGAKAFQDDLKKMTAKCKALDAQMKELASGFDKESKSQERNARERETLNKAIEAQKQKAALLTDQIKQMEAAGEGETAACYKLKQQLSETNTAINNYTSGTKEAATETGVSTGQLIKAGAALGAMSIAAKAAAGVIKGLASAAVNAAKAVWKLGVESGQWADALITQSTQTGVDTETLQEWSYAARFVDTEVSTMTKGMSKLTSAYAKGNKSKKKSVKLTKGVTVSLRKENGEIKTQAEFYLDTIDALHGMTNVAQRNAAAQQIFGKSYTDMLPLIESGTAALRQYGQEAREMGVIITGENVSALGLFDDQMQRLDAQFSAVKTNIALAFLPIMETVAERMSGFMSVVTNAISDGLQEEDIDTIVDGFFALFDPAMTDDGRHSMNAIEFVGKLASKLLTQLGLNKQKFIDIASKITGFLWDGLKAGLGTLWSNFVEGFKNYSIQESNPLYDSFSNLMNGVVKTIKDGWNNFWKYDVPVAIDTIGAEIDLIWDTVTEAVGGGLTSAWQWGYNILDQLGQGVLTAWESLKTTVGGWITAIADFGTNVMTTFGQAVLNGWDTAKTFVDTVWTNLSTVISGWVDAALEDGKKFITNICEGISGAWDTASEFVTSVGTNLFTIVGGWITTAAEDGGTLISGFVSSIYTKWGEKLTTLGNVGTELTTIFGMWVESAKTWGKDLIKNFVKGLKEKWKELKEGVKGLGQGIKNFLGFSEPKEGPLSDFHTYAPDMVSLFVKGLKDNAYKIDDALSSTFGVLPGVSPAAGGGRVTNYGGVTIVVNGAAGQDVNSLADIVMERLQSAVDRREAVFA